MCKLCPDPRLCVGPLVTISMTINISMESRAVRFTLGNYTEYIFVAILDDYEILNEKRSPLTHNSKEIDRLLNCWFIRGYALISDIR